LSESAQGAARGRAGLFWALQGLLRRREAESVREQFEALVGGEEPEGGDGPPALDAAERALLGNVLKLRGKTALDVMIPRADIVAMPVTLTLAEAIRLIQREGHSRFPVYGDNLDDVVGMVHIKDVFAAVGLEDGAPFDLARVMRPPMLVVSGVPVLDLLLQMREARTHLALVVDEYGGIDGLVTIEDLVETITGDIADEHDEDAPPQLVERADGSLDLDARMTVEGFESHLGAPVLTDEERHQDIDTVGGLVLSLAGRVPAKGELVSHSTGLEFRVLEADPRRIRRLRVRRPGAVAAAAASTGTTNTGATTAGTTGTGTAATPAQQQAAE